MKRVSIIITSYNLEKYIDKAITSVINQTYKNIEVIVVDDCSQDDTRQIIKKHQNKYPIIAILKDVNKGISHSRNMGIKKATGDYVVFVDGDDYLKEDMIEKMVNKATEYQADLVDSRQIFTMPKDNEIKYFTANKFYKKDYITTNKENIFKHIHYVHGKLIKKEIITNNFKEGIHCYEDFLFNAYLVNNIKTYVLLNEQFYFYLQRDNSLINTYNLNHLHFITVYEELYGKNKLLDKILYEQLLVILFARVPRLNESFEVKKESFIKLLKTNQGDQLLIKILLKFPRLISLFLIIINKIDFVKIHLNYKMRTKPWKS